MTIETPRRRKPGKTYAQGFKDGVLLAVSVELVVFLSVMVGYLMGVGR